MIYVNCEKTAYTWNCNIYLCCTRFARSDPRRFIAQINVYLKSEALEIERLIQKKSQFSIDIVCRCLDELWCVSGERSWIICYDYCLYYYFYLTWGCSLLLFVGVCVCVHVWCHYGGQLSHKLYEKHIYYIMYIVHIKFTLHNHSKMQATTIKPLINSSSSSIFTFGINYIVNSFVTFFFCFSRSLSLTHSLTSLQLRTVFSLTSHYCCCCWKCDCATNSIQFNRKM